MSSQCHIHHPRHALPGQFYCLRHNCHVSAGKGGVEPVACQVGKALEEWMASNAIIARMRECAEEALAGPPEAMWGALQEIVRIGRREE